VTPEKMIEETIRERGMTIQTVSKRSGVSYSRLQPSLRGRRELRADEYLSICACLGLDPRAYLNGDGEGGTASV
jgi:transcriptional regulator with XRE-family HTH domain